MFGFRKNSQASAPQVIYRDVVRYQSTPEDAALKARHEQLIVLAETEYARLTQIAHQGLERRDAGLPYSDYEVTKANTQVTVIADMLSILKGTDRIIEGVQLEKKAYSRINEEFALNSHLSKNPQYAPKD